MIGKGPNGCALGGPGRQDEQRVERDEREAEATGIGEAQPDDVRLDEGQPILGGGPAGPFSSPVQHRRIEIDAGHRVARLGQRDRQPAGPDAQLEDRALGPIGEREIEVEVAGVVGQVEVVQARECRRGRGVGSVERSVEVARVDGQPSQRTRAAGLALDRERADGFQGGAVGGHRGRLGLVVRRRDLDDVHPGQVDGGDDLADRAQHLAGQHPARFGCPGAGRHAGIDDVDVEREVDRVRSVERLGDRVGDDRLGAALLDLAHEVPAQALLLHPVEGRLRRPVAAQPDLHEVLALDRAGLDEAAHRRPVAGQDAEGVGGGVGVGVEMDDPDAARATDLGDGRRGGPGDRVVATEDDRDRAGLGDLADLAVDHRVAALDPGRHDVRVAGVDHGQDVVRIDIELERVDRARGVLGLADRPRPEAGARPVADGVVERGTDDRDIDAEAAELGGIGDPRQVHERGRADVRRQVEIAVRLEVRVPAVVAREVAVQGGVGRAVCHGILRRRPQRHAARIESVSLGGAAGSKPSSSRTRRAIVAPVGAARPTSQRRRGTPATPPRPAPGP